MKQGRRSNSLRLLGIALLGLLVFGSLPVRAYAHSLFDLQNGAAITMGDKMFSDWNFTKLSSERELDSIEVKASPTSTGLLYEAKEGALARYGSDLAPIELDFNYKVRVLNPSLWIIQ